MAQNRRNITNTFELSTCTLCGGSDVNQYFSINDSYIEYNGIFIKFSDILTELDFQFTSHRDDIPKDVCLDCKDKVLMFYHFKRRVKELSKRNIRSIRANPQKEAPSKIVHSIMRIVENYTEKCSIASIRIDEAENKLIIQPAEEEPTASHRNFQLSASPSICIKEEPLDDFDESQNFNSETSSLADFSDMLVKEEPEEQPVILTDPLHRISVKPPSSLQQLPIDDPTPRRRLRNTSHIEAAHRATVSKAALKMRAYRERLKRPENFHRYLHHQQQQREWNKRHYIKKMEETGKQFVQRNRRPLSTEELSQAAFERIFGANKFTHD